MIFDSINYTLIIVDGSFLARILNQETAIANSERETTSQKHTCRRGQVCYFVKPGAK